MKPEEVKNQMTAMLEDQFYHQTGNVIQIAREELIEMLTKQTIHGYEYALLKCKEAVGEEKEEKHYPDCRPHTLDGKEYECSCGNDAYVKGWNSCRSTTLQNLTNLEK